MDADLPTSAARRALVITTIVVCLVGLLVELARHFLALEDVALVGLLSLSYEGNLPTWYASVLPLVCAALLAWVAAGEPRDRFHWRSLSLGFVAISIDEIIGLHELLSPLVGTTGVLHFGWVIPAGALVLALAVVFLGFLRRLDRPTARTFVLAGALYVTGAVACDIPLGWWTSVHGDDNFVYYLIDWCEETLEYVGLTVFACALLTRLQGRGVRLTPSAPPGAG